VKFFHARSLEWDCSVQHCEKDDTRAPQINVEAVAVLVLEDFRSDVGGSAALLPHFHPRLALLTNAEICNFDRAFAVK
jgi:hypothetical protein